MRPIAIKTAVITLAIAPYALFAASSIKPPNATVGRNLQVVASIRLPEAPPQSGVQLTLTSDDPSRLLLSTGPDKPGAATITLTVLPPRLDTPEFCLQGVGDSGTVTYTVSAPGIESAKGTVTLTHSAILILGPSRVPKYPTTPQGAAARLTIVSAALDASLKVAGEQQIAGGLKLDVTIGSSNPAAGSLKSSKLLLEGGSSTATTSFQPVAEGDTTIAPVQPHGFTAPAQFASVIISVDKPGLSIVGEVYLGKDLQMPGVLCLGEPAPAGGLKVKLTSADGSKLVLSDKEDQAGAATLTLTVPAGQLTATYYLQGLGDSGVVTYEATAPGFRSRSARVGLTPSGVIVTYERYGPPDAASVLFKKGTPNPKEFYTSLAESKEHPVHVTVWTVHLDPDTGRAADITVQALRPGVTATVDLSCDPAVGTVESPLVLRPGTNHVLGRFIPTAKGKTLIKVSTPAGFATPQNATSVPATVTD